MKRSVLLLPCMFAASLLPAPAWGSGDWPNDPKWTLRKLAQDPEGATALLSPANDTRVNLALLLADRSTPQQGKVHKAPFFSWRQIDHGLEAGFGDGRSNRDGPASRCQTMQSGAAAFATAVQAASGLSATERQTLIAARQGIQIDCAGEAGQAPELALDGLKSTTAKQFAAYVRGAGAFYAGDFAAARAAFAGLASARDPWLRETALYMVGRTELNRAIASAVDEYGNIGPGPKVDRTAIDGAIQGFDAYRHAYPAGRYTASATGLMRRVFWLGGNSGNLASTYGALLGSTDQASGLMLIEEIDDKLLFDPINTDWFNPPLNKLPALSDPRIVAVVDLWRMRQESSEFLAKGEKPRPQITRAEIEGQKTVFGNEPDLYGYLLAAEALYVRNQPREVLELIPDAARQKPFTFLQFSRQALRGLALDAVKDPNARGFWLEMLAGASQPWQREAVELALAMHEERNGGLARAFAPDSQIHNRAIREVLLEYAAGPDVLRQQARNASLSTRERAVALYTLLTKELGRGYYAQYIEDVKLIPVSLREHTGDLSSGRSGADDTSDDEEQAPPLGLFSGQGQFGDFGCPALAQTATALARAPQAAGARLCLADFMRLNGFDHFTYDETPPADELGGAPSQFPGKPYSRQAVYVAVMSDRTASANEKAYALYRAVRCYAPAGNNDCGGVDVAIPQRRAWFQRLQREFPQSRWAKALSVYW